MALIESGTFGSFPAVSECSALPLLAVAWGIDAPATMTTISGDIEVPVLPPKIIGGMEWRLFRHPGLLVPDTCRLWKSEYRVKTKYGSRLEYEDFNPCYIYAEEIYENYGGGINGRNNTN